MTSPERTSDASPVRKLLDTWVDVEALQPPEIALAEIITIGAKQVQEEAEKRNSSNYLSLALKTMQAALSEPRLSDTPAGVLATNIMELHRENAGGQTEILLSQPQVLSEPTEDPWDQVGLTLHNHYDDHPQGQLAESGLVIEFRLEFTPERIDRLTMQLNQRLSHENHRLRGEFGALSDPDKLAVMWLFMDATHQAVIAIPIFDQQTSDDL